MRQKSLKRATKIKYNYIIEQIPNRYINSNDLNKYKNYLERKRKKGEKLSKKSIALYLSVLRRFWKWEQKDFINCSYNTFNISYKLKRAFTKEELKALIKSADKFTASWIYILYASGLRVGELINGQLKRTDEHYKIGFIGKGKKDPETLIINLNDQKLIKELNIFFDIDNMTEREYYKMWKSFNQLKIKLDIKDKKKTIHSIRHSAANEFYRKGGIYEAQRVLRHQSERMTLIYIRQDNSTEIRETNRLNLD